MKDFLIVILKTTCFFIFTLILCGLNHIVFGISFNGDNWIACSLGALVGLYFLHTSNHDKQRD